MDTKSATILTQRTIRYAPSTTGDGKLVFVGTPLDISSRSVDPEQYQSRFPKQLTSLSIRSLLPDIGVPVLRRCHNAIRVGSPINSGDEFVVLRDYILASTLGRR